MRVAKLLLGVWMNRNAISHFLRPGLTLFVPNSSRTSAKGRPFFPRRIEASRRLRVSTVAASSSCSKSFWYERASWTTTFALPFTVSTRGCPERSISRRCSFVLRWKSLSEWMSDS